MPEKKNQSHKPPITPKTDPQRETRVLMEEVRSELKIVAEGHGSIVKRLDRVEEKLEQHDQRFDKIEGKLGRIEGQLGQLQEQVGSVLKDHEGRLKTVEQKLEVT